MFLAIKEIQHNKLHYGLIIFMIMLISYLIFILTSLATGLAAANRQVIDTWQADNIVLNAAADGSLTKSTLTSNQVQPLVKSSLTSSLGEMPVTINKAAHVKVGAELLGIRKNQFIYQEMRISSGHKFRHNFEAVVDSSLQNKGYHVGDQLKIAADKPAVKIVGFVKGAQLSVSPVIYTSLFTWQRLKFGNNRVANCSAVVLKNNYPIRANSTLEKLSIAEFIKKLPGYRAQILTFEFMIGFLMIIMLIVIAIFLYILTIQKLPVFAVLKAQGIPTNYLITNTIVQTLLMTVSGLICGIILTVITKLVLPPAVPITFNYSLLLQAAIALLFMSILGALIPVWTIKKIDPVTVIGGN